MHEYRLADNKVKNKPPGCDLGNKKNSLRVISDHFVPSFLLHMYCLFTLDTFRKHSKTNGDYCFLFVCLFLPFFVA